jgi:hypothetical protein
MARTKESNKAMVHHHSIIARCRVARALLSLHDHGTTVDALNAAAGGGGGGGGGGDDCVMDMAFAADLVVPFRAVDARDESLLLWKDGDASAAV